MMAVLMMLVNMRIVMIRRRKRMMRIVTVLIMMTKMWLKKDCPEINVQRRSQSGCHRNQQVTM